MEDLQRLYSERGGEIRQRLQDFRKFLAAGKDEIFPELAFCLCTPQSKAESCWAAVQELQSKGLLFGGTAKEIAKVLKKKVRFHNNKAKWIVQARGLELRLNGDQREDREWLVENVKGLGYKEASHFLRNVGRGDKLTILDRHVLKNLTHYKAIPEVPKSLTPRKYKEIELAMEAFAGKLGVSVAELDLLFWSKEAGKVFK